MLDLPVDHGLEEFLDDPLVADEVIVHDEDLADAGGVEMVQFGEDLLLRS